MPVPYCFQGEALRDFVSRRSAWPAHTHTVCLRKGKFGCAAHVTCIHFKCAEPESERVQCASWPHQDIPCASLRHHHTQVRKIKIKKYWETGKKSEGRSATFTVQGLVFLICLIVSIFLFFFFEKLFFEFFSPRNKKTAQEGTTRRRARKAKKQQERRREKRRPGVRRGGGSERESEGENEDENEDARRHQGREGRLARTGHL